MLDPNLTQGFDLGLKLRFSEWSSQEARMMETEPKQKEAENGSEEFVCWVVAQGY